MTSTNGTEPTLTLHQFCDQINDHLGRDTGVEQAVLNYRQHSNAASLYDTKSEFILALKGEVGRHLDAGRGAAMIGRARIERTPPRTTRQRRLTSAAVKKHDHGLWVVSQKPSVRLAIKTDQLQPKKPTGTKFASIQAAWAALERARETGAEHTRRAEAAREQIRAVFGECRDTWDGALFPTADGWAVGWSEVETFNAGLCKEIAERRGIDLEPMKTYITVNHAETFKLIEPDEFDEVDEIDGQ